MESKNTFSQKAFTLIELLIVIAIIAILLTIIAPALQMAKRKASVAVCVASLRKMATGWVMYQEENKGRIMSANDDSGSKAYDDQGRFFGWIGIPRDIDGNRLSITQSDPVTDNDEIRGIELGLLYPYVNEAKAYRCPSNYVNKSIYDNTEVFVSYSIPESLFGFVKKTNPNQVVKYSSISFPETRYCFVEAFEARNWNSGHHFVLGAPEATASYWAWWGPVSINHGNSSAFAFSDGHVERRIWMDPFTYEHMEKLINQGGGSYGIQRPPADQQSDIKYMANGWPYRHPLN